MLSSTIINLFGPLICMSERVKEKKRAIIRFTQSYPQSIKFRCACYIVLAAVLLGLSLENFLHIHCILRIYDPVEELC